jgi:DNA-binding response OmpR family regulator
MGEFRRRTVRTILAAGGNRAALNEIALRIGELGHLVALGDPGGHALDLIAARGFDLVLLEDGACGLHVLREIRSAGATADLPIVMLCAENDTAAMLAALAAGADDCVTRPLSFELLWARIERIFRHGARVDELKRSNLALDARIAARAIELGETRGELAAARAELVRLSPAHQSPVQRAA